MNTNEQPPRPGHDPPPSSSETNHRTCPESLRSFIRDFFGPREHGEENHVVIWDGQRCFDWVDPSDLLTSLVQPSQVGHPPPAMTIIEYHSAQSSSHVGALDEGLIVIGNRLDAIDERLNVMGKRLDAVCEGLEQAIIPLAEQSRSLRNNELDMHVVRPHLELIIQTLSRMDEELRDDTNDGVYGVLRGAREADREEYSQLLRHYGVSAMYPQRGAPFSPSIHKVISRCATDSAKRVGRVRRVVRPAYIRERDEQVIQRAWVEVYVPGKPKTSP